MAETSDTKAADPASVITDGGGKAWHVSAETRELTRMRIAMEHKLDVIANSLDLLLTAVAVLVDLLTAPPPANGDSPGHPPAAGE